MFSSGYDSGLLPPEDWPHKTWLAMVMSGDNQGPHTADQVSDYLAVTHMSRDENENKIFVSCDQPSYDGVGDAITLGYTTAYVHRDRKLTGSQELLMATTGMLRPIRYDSCA